MAQCGWPVNRRAVLSTRFEVARCGPSNAELQNSVFASNAVILTRTGSRIPRIPVERVFLLSARCVVVRPNV